MTTAVVHDQKLDKQMGCMAGLLQLFDRNQILTGKRVSATKRLPSNAMTAVDSATESEKTDASPAVLTEFEKPQQTRAMTPPSSDRLKAFQATELRSLAPEIATPSKLPLNHPVSEFKEGTRSSCKFSKEAPRLSLDSRATVDAKGSLYPRDIRTNAAVLPPNRRDSSRDGAVEGDDKRRSPSVIARLMGLEPLQHSTPEPMKKAELRRSASESRVSRDLFQYRFIDGNNFQLKQPIQSRVVVNNISSFVVGDNAGIGNTTPSFNGRRADPLEYSRRNPKSEPPKHSYRGVGASPWKPPQQRKGFFDSADFYPEPKQTASVYGEIDKRLRMRGIDEPSMDLETLKQILEALQLKGLLHSKKSSEQIRRRNFVHGRSFSSEESPIVVIKPSRSPVSPISRRIGNDSPPAGFRSRDGARRNPSYSGESFSSGSPRRERPEIDRTIRTQARATNSSSPTRRENDVGGPNSSARKKSLSVVTRKKANESKEQRRVSPVHSPKLSPRRFGSDQTVTTRSPRNTKPTAEIGRKDKITICGEDESSSISESSVSTSSQTDTERWKMEYKEGRNLLERCDKLLHSIAEMAATELQPSPVSVLDSSFYKDDSSCPSPVMKRSIIEFKADQHGEIEEEIWSPAISRIQSRCEDKPEDCDFAYISDMLRASNCLPEGTDIFLLLEKQQYLKGKDTSEVSRLRRQLIFDTVTEILNRNGQLPPWKVFSCSNSSVANPSPREIWSEFRRIGERDAAEDLFDVICGVLRKDLAGDAVNGWRDRPVETSEAVLDIERLIFKDLVGETIRDLAAFSGNSTVSASCRKLVF